MQDSHVSLFLIHRGDGYGHAPDRVERPLARRVNTSLHAALTFQARQKPVFPLAALLQHRLRLLKQATASR